MLVIIGLLLGGVVKGQELISSARVRNMIAQQEGVKAASLDSRTVTALPGDRRGRYQYQLRCDPRLNGNGNGLIEAATGSVAHEEIWFGTI